MKRKKKNTLYNHAELAVIYFGLLGVHYDKIDNARKLFDHKKANNELDQKVLRKSVFIYSKKILESLHK